MLLGLFAAMLVTECKSDASGPSAAPNPVPVLTSLSQDSVPVGTTSFQLTAVGTGLRPSTTVRWNGITLPTQALDSTHVSATIAASLASTPDSVGITAATPGPGGGVSAALPFLVLAPMPVIDSLGRDTITADQGGIALDIYGHSFSNTATVNVKGSPHPTTWISANHLQITLYVSDLATPGQDSITAVNPGPGRRVSAPAVLDVLPAPPVPHIAGIRPDSVITTSGAVTIQVVGSGFTRKTSATVGNGSRTVQFQNDTSILVTLAPGDVADALTTYYLTLTTPPPGGGTSNAWPIDVWNPIPRLDSISPDTIFADSGTFVITFFGSGFVRGSGVVLGPLGQTTQFVDTTRLRVTLTKANSSGSGTASARVVTSYRGGTSASLPFTLLALRPHIDSITPTVDSVGSSDQGVVVWGRHLDPAAQVSVNGALVPLQFNSTSESWALIPASIFARPDTLHVAVINPAPGGASDSVLLAVLPPNPLPVVDSLTPQAATVGLPAETISVHGHGFLPGTTVAWHGTVDQAIPDTIYGTDSMAFVLPESLMTQIRSIGIAITPPAPTSGAQQVSLPVWTPGVTDIRKLPISATALAGDSLRSVIYAGVGSGGSARLLRIDPATGIIGDSLSVPDQADHLVLSGNDGYLYASIPATSQILRVDLTTFTVDATITLGRNPLGYQYTPDLVVVSPTAPKTIAVLVKFTSLPIGTLVFDDTIERPKRWDTWATPNALMFNATGDSLIGFNGSNGVTLQYRMALSDSGIVAVDSSVTASTMWDVYSISDYAFGGSKTLLNVGVLLGLDGSAILVGHNGPPAAEPSGSAFYQASGNSYADATIRLWRIDPTGASEASVGFPSDGSGLSALARWSVNGLAVATPGALLLVRTTIAH